MEVTVYHGSGTNIDQFDYKFTGIGNDQIGSGFYFTTDINEAESYCTAKIDIGNQKDKPGGLDNPTIHEVKLSLNKTIDTNHQTLFKLKDIIQIIVNSPDLYDRLSDWGDVEFEGKEKLILEAAENYIDNTKMNTLQNLYKLSNDFYPNDNEKFFSVIKSIYGFDSAMIKFDHKTHYVAWFPNQIEIVNKIHLNNTNQTHKTVKVR